jgi:hypothetical protein
VEYSQAVREVQDGFDARREHLAGLALSQAFDEHDIYGRGGLMHLWAGTEPARANEHLRWVAAWYDHPHPHGRDHRGEVDFTAIRLARIAAQFADRLEPATAAAIERFLLTTDYESMYSGGENHSLQFHTSRLVAAQTLADRRFEAYANQTGRELAGFDTQWLTRFIQFRARQGWAEFDSLGYVSVDMESLVTIRDFAADLRLRRLAEDMCNLLLADIVVDMLQGVMGGAHGRSYAANLLETTSSTSHSMMHLYFGLGRAEAIPVFHPIECLISDFRPDPLLVDIAIGRREPYINRERKHLHRCSDAMPAVAGPGSIRKLTWWCPQFVIGAVQFQDPYGADSPDVWYARHQQVEWELLLGGQPPVSVFTHHPDRQVMHMYWSGDNDCECGSFFQNGQAVLGVYRITPKSKFQYIHAHLPRRLMDEVVQRGAWMFLRRGPVFAGLRSHHGWRWTTEGEDAGRELISDGPTHGIVCEAGLAGEYESFAAFQDQLAGATIKFDARAVSLEYHSPRHGRLGVDANGGRSLNGRPADLDYPTWDSPYLRSAWDSGVVELSKDGHKRVMDFRS